MNAIARTWGWGPRLLALAGAVLMLCGLFALWLAANRRLLPHDEAYLGLALAPVCGAADGRLLHFMFHDRVAFGGAVIAIGLLYLWLAASPLRRGEAWAWWLLVLTGLVGFGSFLTYLGFGYLDTWHAAATLLLLPLYALGLAASYGTLRGPRGPRTLLRAIPAAPAWRSGAGVGRACLLATAGGLVLAGFVIMGVGMTEVFVPQDLRYLGLGVEQLRVLSPRLIPLIAHDRAGFGGALASVGVAMFFSVWCARPSRGLWRVLAAAGGTGFATAIGVHPIIGYTEVSHLAPAWAGLALFGAGLALSRKGVVSG